MSTKLERIIWIDKQIRAERYPNAHKVKQHFELRNVRTAYEDRKFMINRLGAPIKYSRTKGGWYYQQPNYILPAIILTKEEVVAFFLGEELVKRYLGTPFEQPIRLALEKIKQYLPEQVSFEKDKIAFTFTEGATVSVNPELILDFYQAVIDQKQVEMQYYTASRDELTKRIVEPYHLHNIRGNWYLIAFCRKRKEFRNFLLGRIREYKLLHTKFTKDSEFSLEEYLKSGFIAERGSKIVEVVIKFDAYQARWIKERKWHPSQEIEELSSGGLLLKLKVSGLEEVKRWVMSYGSHAEVLEPESLRQEIEKEIKKMGKIYKNI